MRRLWLQGDTKLSAVVHWLRLKATSPAPPAARSTSSSSSKRARRFPAAGQQPAQQAQHATQQAQQGGTSASSISNAAASLARGLHAEAVAPFMAPSLAASPAANLPAAAVVDIASSSDAVSVQQEHTYTDMLAQWRSNVFEDIAVLIPDELPAAGMTSGMI